MWIAEKGDSSLDKSRGSLRTISNDTVPINSMSIPMIVNILRFLEDFIFVAGRNVDPGDHGEGP